MNDAKLLSPDTNDALAEFKKADEKFQKALTDFYSDHEKEIEYLEKLRETRNKFLDATKRGMREDARAVDITETKTIKAAPFTVQKKWSPRYIPEMFVEFCKNQGIYDEAVEGGIIKIVTTVPNFKSAKSWVQSKEADDLFQQAEDGLELTPSVTGPKPVPPIGAELK